MNQRPASAQPDSLTASSPVQETEVESAEEQTDTESTDEQEDTVEFHDKAVENEVSFLLGKGNYSVTVGDMETDTIKNTKSLHICGECTDIQDIIRYFPNITDLTIEKYTGDGDICAEVCTFKQLEQLSLTYGGNALDIDSLAQLHQLKTLRQHRIMHVFDDNFHKTAFDG